MTRVLALVAVVFSVCGWTHGTQIGLVATRTFTPWILTNTNFQSMSRNEHHARAAITSIAIVLPNWYVDSQVNAGTWLETSVGGTSTVTASIEYPAGTFTQLKFSGIATGTVSSGGNLVSDFTTVSIPNGAEFWTRIYTQNPSGVLFTTICSAALGEGVEQGTSGVTDKTLGGSISASNFCAPPIAIIGRTTTLSVCLIGDSRVQGPAADYAVTSPDIGILAPSIGPNYGYANFGISGNRASFFVASHTKQVALMNSYCTDIIVALGINDGVSDVPTLQSNLAAIYAMFPGKRVDAVTIDPHSSSTDGWATTTNQTALDNLTSMNTWIRALGAPVNKVFDMADVTMSARNSNIWKAPGYTVDGLHETPMTTLLIQTSGVVAP